MILLNLCLLVIIVGLGWTIFELLQQRTTLKNTIKNQWNHIQTLRKKALYDPVTGLPNRFFFEANLNRVFNERKRNESALLYIDLNGFKAVNDTYGHAVGDATLKKVSDILISTLRAGDIVARLGGDEFALIIKSKHNRRVVDRILKQFTFSGVQVNCGGKNYKVAIGLSIGAVRINEGIDTMKELLRIGDRAMYRAKDMCKSSRLINCQQWGAPISAGKVVEA